MYGQSNPPSSQPEWRLPTRPSQPLQSGPPPPPPPRPPPAPYSPAGSYSPATYGPISHHQVPRLSSPAGADKTTWGVRYNSQSPGPPLPPRPSSTEQSYTYGQSSNPSIAPPVQYQASLNTQPPPPPPPPAYTPTPPVGVPQPPPKIPQGFQNAPTPQTDQKGRAPLLAQGVGPAAMTGSYETRPAPVINTNAASTGASALGPGSPSDWEHLVPTPGEFDDAAWFPPRKSPPLHQQGFQHPPGPPSGPPNVPAGHIYNMILPQRTDTNESYASAMSRPTQSGRDNAGSPVSPCTTPPPLVRLDTSSTTTSMGRHSESIDNVIEAWVRPLSPAGRPVQPEHERRSSSFHQTSPVERSQSAQAGPSLDEQLHSSSTSSAQMVERSTSAAPTKDLDPFEDLDPWSKSSLQRYVAMLRKEAVADSDEERYKIFTAFMSKETKLREILYNIEHEPQSTSVTTRTPDSAPQPAPSVPSKPEPPIESGLIPVETEYTPSLSGATGDDDDVRSEYSAGGRPLLGKQARQGSLFLPSSSTPVSSRFSRPLSMATSTDSQKQGLEPLATNPPRPIYTPFQYTEGPQRGSDNLVFARPAYQAYSDLRQAAVSGRVTSNAPPTSRLRSNTALISPTEQDETFLGLIRHKSVAYTKPAERQSPPLPLLPESLRQGPPVGLVEELRTIVWTPLDKQSESSWHITTREELDKFSDDFSYIQQTVDQWEETAQARRQKLEQERQARQEESEAHIDDLFNEKVIGYADINTLEEEFRQTEARVQLEEERHELDDFIKHVVGPLDERLKDEISALRQLHDSALNKLDRDQQGEGSPKEQCSPSVTMRMVNGIHQKLETRFRKRLEIALDCERRRKKAERRPLVFMGDMAGLRKLDGEFDQMERRNILEACKDRDDRANRLMDFFDDAILHGLGINQTLLDEVAAKVARLDASTLRAPGLPDSEIEQILKSAATFAASLKADSEAIIRSSEDAEVALNDADYEVSVAEARYANADPDVLHRLADEKKKEDDKIRADMDLKLQSIQKGPVHIETTIERLLLALRNEPRGATPVFPAQAPLPKSPLNEVPLPPSLRPATVAPVSSPSPEPVSQSTDEDLEHKQRLRRALDEAKKRNASR
ncbi:uncharacterized protein N7515_009340 [Penicillium bovifimosum]|uniref:Uncharacterized protein n=1 Tax=Penicillium bovifimosum TaxID=126998 RepID=A0A9W9GK72_9EURO|nr:uncharacterized protein N7515_009340 [Penicillium bovifimosum]KAJ5121379.1 hypothetical protein N7515_009340 [Penicillium bovifimosum]